MIPGEYRVADGDIVLNRDRRILQLIVANKGDRPIQVGSHYHFFEVNRGLSFPREQAFGMRLDIPAGTAVRFEPGEAKPVQLVELGGQRKSFGLNGLSNGAAINGQMTGEVQERLSRWEEKDT